MIVLIRRGTETDVIKSVQSIQPLDGPDRARNRVQVNVDGDTFGVFDLNEYTVELLPEN